MADSVSAAGSVRLPTWLRLAPVGQTSVAIMAATAVASLVGYAFWVLVARATDPSTLGKAAVAITTFTLLGNVASMGVRNVMVARLPAASAVAEWSREFNEGLAVALLTTTVVLGGALVWFLLFSTGSALGVIVFAAGALMTAVAGVVDAACVAERASRLLVGVTAVSAITRVLLVSLVLITRSSWEWIATVWVVSLALGNAIGLTRLLRRRPGSRIAAGMQWGRIVEGLPHHVLQHINAVSAFGATAILPLIVAVRISPAASGYFYASWRLGGVFMIVSPAVTSALVAEGARSRAQLGSIVRHSSILIGLLLAPACLALILFGHPLLAVFGAGYAEHGYWLMVVLVLASVPDAITNIYVAVARVYERIGTAAALNGAMGVATIAIAWIWLPSLGVVAAGLGWLIAQSVGALAVPALSARLRGVGAQGVAGPKRRAVSVPLGRDAASAEKGDVTLSLAVVEDVDAFADQWSSLARRSAPSNPFASPGWLIPWAQHFVPADDLRVMTVSRGQELIGVAPFYLARHRLGFRRLGAELQLLGAGRASALTELPQILVAEGQARPVLRHLFRELVDGAPEFEWLHVTLPPAQGWFEPQWVGESPNQALIVQKGTRAAVVMEEIDASTLTSSISPNLREALRKARRRLGREGREWSVSTPANERELEEALAVFFDLHGARARAVSRPPHPDHFEQESRRRFLLDAGRRLFASGDFIPYTLSVDGEPAASQVVLRSPRCTYLYFSGLDPRWWSYGLGALLQFECISDAVSAGPHTVNLSLGPDVAKLRWRGTLSLHNDFVIVPRRRRSHALFAAYWSVRGAGLVVRELRRNAAPSR